MVDSDDGRMMEGRGNWNYKLRALVPLCSSTIVPRRGPDKRLDKAFLELEKQLESARPSIITFSLMFSL